MRRKNRRSICNKDFKRSGGMGSHKTKLGDDSFLASSSVSWAAGILNAQVTMQIADFFEFVSVLLLALGCFCCLAYPDDGE